MSILFIILNTTMTFTLNRLYSKDGNPSYFSLSWYGIPDSVWTSLVVLPWTFSKDTASFLYSAGGLTKVL